MIINAANKMRICEVLIGVARLLAPEHDEELSSKFAAREEVEKEVGYVVQVEQQMCQAREEFVLDCIRYFSLGSFSYK